MSQKLPKTDDLIFIRQHRTHTNKFCVQLLYDIDALQPESSWQIVLKKSEEGSDADKIKHLNEKAVFTSSYFGVQNIWDLYLYKLTVDQYTEISKALSFAWCHLILKWRELHSQTEPRAHRLRALQARSPVPKAVGSLSLLLPKCSYSGKKAESQWPQGESSFTLNYMVNQVGAFSVFLFCLCFTKEVCLRDLKCAREIHRRDAWVPWHGFQSIRKISGQSDQSYPVVFFIRLPRDGDTAPFL